MTDSIDSELGRHLLRAARRILRPLVRILIRNGITTTVAEELLRKVYVEVAHDEFKLPGKQQTLARVSVITGLNRKEVARLHSEPPLDQADQLWWNRAGTVLAGWLTDDAYHSEAGFPIDLPFAGATPCFTDLVKQYSGDMYPRSVADELLRLGAIVEVEGKLRMSKRGYVPSADPALMIDILGMDVSEFIETIDYNLQSGRDNRLLQIKVLASNLPEEHLAEFNVFSKRLSLHTIDEITRWLSAHDAGKDDTGTDARYAAGIGIFQINTLRRAHQAQAGATSRKKKGKS